MFKNIQDQLGALSTVMQESLTGVRVVKAFAREPYEMAKFDQENDGWFNLRYKLIKTWANNWPFSPSLWRSVSSFCSGLADRWCWPGS